MADAGRRAPQWQPADGAGKLAGRARDVRVRGAWRRQSELPAALAEQRDATELCTPAWAQFAERSSAGRAAARLSDAPESQPAGQQTRLQMAMWQKVLVPREVESADGPVVRRPAWFPPEAPNVQELEQPALHSRKPLEAVLRAWPAAQPRS